MGNNNYCMILQKQLYAFPFIHCTHFHRFVNSSNVFTVAEVLRSPVLLNLFRFTDMKCLAKSEYYTRTSAELNLFDHLSHTITTYYLFLELLSAFHLLQMQDAHYLTEFCLSVCELLCNRDARTVIFLIYKRITERNKILSNNVRNKKSDF